MCNVYTMQKIKIYFAGRVAPTKQQRSLKNKIVFDLCFSSIFPVFPKSFNVFFHSEAFKAEQAIKDENVSEYLQLTSNADKHQIGRIKSVFEKKNSKSNATLAQVDTRCNFTQMYFFQSCNHTQQRINTLSQ